MTLTGGGTRRWTLTVPGPIRTFCVCARCLIANYAIYLVRLLCSGILPSRFNFSVGEPAVMGSRTGGIIADPLGNRVSCAILRQM